MEDDLTLQNNSEETPKNTKASNEKKIIICNLMKERFEKFKSGLKKD
jgi:hypothetical protein